MPLPPLECAVDELGESCPLAGQWKSRPEPGSPELHTERAEHAECVGAGDLQGCADVRDWYLAPDLRVMMFV